ncbi:hypothetical protein GKA53_20205 [Vibrio parahaemolyticus]|nr:hypothetical protein [Vibrio parahaemolyticus]EGQ8852401.1 hypothetical protein [Vibrio parahaemolyticus]EGQ8857030.1 hypothetical protein [Vibrio parahaemolyticus]EGQ8876431.1 hypothetical protein [Vibrio parahaemolyticus]EGQ8995711.1 hypothetical protein [Vibrio parahaemolyticus]
MIGLLSAMIGLLMLPPSYCFSPCFVAGFQISVEQDPKSVSASGVKCAIATVLSYTLYGSHTRGGYMTIATRLDEYLTEHNIHFQTVNHSHSNSSLQSGVAAGVPLMNIAKGVILEDHEGRHMMAVLPANNKISLSRLNDEFNATFHLVKERMVYRLFTDCEHGAIPPIGSPYHMATVCDERLANLEHVYLEAGDHETLIKLDRKAFKDLMNDCKYLRFSSEVLH